MKSPLFLLSAIFLAYPLSAQIAAPPQPNTATIPAGKLEKDFYDWDKRHAEILAIKDKIDPEIVLIGDSITHLWAGPPNEPQGNRGAEAWKDLFGEKRVLNLGFGWDRTQNVLFRIANGELDGLDPKTIVIHIGTNNLATSKNAATNTPEEISEAIVLVAEKAHAKCPNAKIIVMAVFPRGEKADNPMRGKVTLINEHLAKVPWKKYPWITYIDITKDFLNSDGTMSREVMGDFLHPAAKGYAIWAAALKPHLK